jgi:hypothetical protein
MIRRADALSDAVIKEMRVVTVTGRIVGDYAMSARRVLMIEVAPDTEVEVSSA